jgi:hypothetical protein
LIQNSKKGSDFKISDKIRLKAKRRCTEETDKIFNERESESFMKYGALISFPEDQKKIIGNNVFFILNGKTFW